MKRRTEPPGLSLAERKRRVVRDELGEAALRLLARQGYDQTSVDQIVEAAGVSRRTFFRYFASKEDVVVEFFNDVGQEIVTELAARPAAEGPVLALREAIKAVSADELAENREKSIALIGYSFGIPALRARFAARQDLLFDEVAEVLAQRTGNGAPAPQLRLTAGLGLMAFTAALGAWVAADGARDFRELVDEAFEQAANAFAV